MPLRAPAALLSHQWRRLLRRHRRLVIAGCLLVSVLCGLESLSPAAPPTVPVLVATGDLTAGRALKAGDLQLARLPPSVRPRGVLDAPDQAVGRILAAPVRRGEPLTDVRLLGPALVGTLGPGLVAVPVRLADSATAGLVDAGDRVDLLAAPADAAGGRARVLASDVRVLEVPPVSAADPGDGALIVLAASREVALAAAAASTTDRLSFSLLPG